jgi:hypothetical protein
MNAHYCPISTLGTDQFDGAHLASTLFGLELDAAALIVIIVLRKTTEDHGIPSNPSWSRSILTRPGLGLHPLEYAVLAVGCMPLGGLLR